MDLQTPDKTKYFEYGLPIIKLYRKHVYKLMHAYVNAKRTQEDAELVEDSEKLLKEIYALSEKTYAQRPPLFNDFQKEIAIVHAKFEKILLDFFKQEYSIKIILMSLFYFWFTLEAPLYAAVTEAVTAEDVFPQHMSAIIDIIKNIIRTFPNPTRTPEIEALNEKMQLLKSYLPKPEILDKIVPENIHEQTSHINTSIYNLINECINQDLSLESIAIAVFSHWMRLSVFFGITESEWQKMDHYFPDILKEVRNYLHSIIGNPEK